MSGRLFINKGRFPVKISSGKTVSIEYTMSFEEGSPIEAGTDKEPLSYVQGGNEILAGIEEALEGLEAGDARIVSLTPDQAFGPVDPEAIVVVEKSRLPEDAWQEGAVVETQDEDGETMAGEVISLSEQMATVDFNHPLAGKTLEFDITVLSVSEDDGKTKIIELNPGNA